MTADKNKWSSIQCDPAEPPPEKIERGGMIVVLSAGLVLFIGGLLFVWKIGAFDMNGFFGKSAGSSPWAYRDILYLLHAPWVAGAWMIKAAVKYFWRKKTEKTGRIKHEN